MDRNGLFCLQALFLYSDTIGPEFRKDIVAVQAFLFWYRKEGIHHLEENDLNVVCPTQSQVKDLAMGPTATNVCKNSMKTCVVFSGQNFLHKHQFSVFKTNKLCLLFVKLETWETIFSSLSLSWKFDSSGYIFIRCL